MELKYDLNDPMVPTLNKMGYMFNDSTHYGEEFVQFSAKSGGPVLDIATAYGSTTLSILSKNISVVANDLEPKHLEILQTRVPENLKHLLECVPGRFPTQLTCKSNHFQAILIANVLHFLNGEEVSLAIQKTFEWLKPGGKVFVIVATPYVSLFESFIPQFEENRKNKMKWPGYLKDFSTLPFNERLAQLPGFMHFFHPEDLKAAFEEQGFTVEKSEFIPRKNLPEDLLYDGRECVGLVARKEA